MPRHGKRNHGSCPDDDPDGRDPEGLRGAAGAAKQRAGPAPARGRVGPSPPPRPGLGPPSRTRSPGGWRSNCRGWRTGAACGRPSGPAPGGWTSRPSTCSDDYWWVTATPAGTDPDDAAMAVVRIQGQQAPPALRGGLLGPHLLTGRRPGEPPGTSLTAPGGSPGPEPGRMPGAR